MVTETMTPFNRCHFDPCALWHVVDEVVTLDTKHLVRSEKPPTEMRINLVIYVDDGRTWDTCAAICDAFYIRLADAFSITLGGGLEFLLGMDISMGEGWLKITSRTYISALCKKWLDHPIEEYKQVYTPADKNLMDYYETAVTTRGDGFDGTTYRELVGALMWPAPTTRCDVLFVVGIHARAMTFPTSDLFHTALRVLVFLGQTMNDGIMYSANAPNAREYIAWSDSDWAVSRSTSGGIHTLAGGAIDASSRKQECVTGSSTHAEAVAASSVSNDVLCERGILGEFGLPQTDPTKMMVDNANVLTIVQNRLSSKKVRHITRRELIVREREVEGYLVVTKVHTSDNLADLMTKVLDRVPFESLRKRALHLLRFGVTVTTGGLRVGRSVDARI